jgi:hypothetical protein
MDTAFTDGFSLRWWVQGWRTPRIDSKTQIQGYEDFWTVHKGSESDIINNSELRQLFLFRFMNIVCLCAFVCVSITIYCMVRFEYIISFNYYRVWHIWVLSKRIVCVFSFRYCFQITFSNNCVYHLLSLHLSYYTVHLRVSYVIFSYNGL